MEIAVSEERESEVIRNEGVGGGERLRMDSMRPTMACSSAVRTDAECGGGGRKCYYLLNMRILLCCSFSSHRCSILLHFGGFQGLRKSEI